LPLLLLLEPSPQSPTAAVAVALNLCSSISAEPHAANTAFAGVIGCRGAQQNARYRPDRRSRGGSPSEDSSSS
jgi:hypothetical protein